nr:unnamed protein product [Digitaria exilis]
MPARRRWRRGVLPAGRWRPVGQGRARGNGIHSGGGGRSGSGRGRRRLPLFGCLGGGGDEQKLQNMTQAIWLEVEDDGQS